VRGEEVTTMGTYGSLWEPEDSGWGQS